MFKLKKDVADTESNLFGPGDVFLLQDVQDYGKSQDYYGTNLWPGCQLVDGKYDGTPPMAEFTNIVECSLQDDNSIYPRTCNVQSEEYDRESPGSEDMEMERPEVQSSQVVGKG